MKNRKNIILVGVCIVFILAGIFLYGFVFKSVPMRKQEVIEQKGLTQEVKQKIIEQLTSSSTTPLTAKDGASVIKKISTTTKPLSSEEKTKILENLKK